MAVELRPHQAALVVLNMQRRVLDSPIPGLSGHGDDADEAPENCRALVRAMRLLGRPVIFTKIEFARDHADAALPRQMMERILTTEPGFLVEGSEDVQFLSELAPLPGEYVVVQKGLDSFRDTPLDRLLANLQVEQCVFAGGGIREAVLTSMRTSTALGYGVFFAEDALFPRSFIETGAPEWFAECSTTADIVSRVMAAATEPAELGSEHPAGGKSALIVVDVQKVFLERERAGHSLSDRQRREIGEANRLLVANIRLLTAAAQKSAMPVIYLKFTNRADGLDAGFPNTGRGKDWVRERPRNWLEWGTELADGLVPRDSDVVIEKAGNSGFNFTPLHRVLRNIGIRRCIVTGGAAPGCVAATVGDGASLGYTMITVSDALYPRSPSPLPELAIYGELRTTAEVLHELPAS